MAQSDFLYYGLFLTKESKEVLAQYAIKWLAKHKNRFNKDTMRFFIDHCTLLFHAQLEGERAETLKAWLGKNINLEMPLQITHIGYSNKAIAFKVAHINYMTMNKIPHITIATYNGGKPKDSNDIIHWEEINEKLVCDSVLKKILPNPQA